MKKWKTTMAAVITAGLAACWSVQAEEGHEHHGDTSGMLTVKGEVLDMACYLDHGAQGEKHADCAKRCIESGLPVGIKAEDGKTYLIIGEHKPLNKQLAEHAAKTITVRGKHVERDGIHMIANAEIVK